MRYLAILAAVFLAGCVSLDAGLNAEDATCAQTGAITAYVACLNRVEEPVWLKAAPANMADYRTFAAARLAMAEDLNSNRITQAQFKEGAAKARAEFQAALVKSSARQQPQARQAGDDMENILQRSPQPGMDGMGMNGMQM